MISPPPVVDDRETIVRCVCSPYHLDKRGARLHWKAFHPQNGTDKVSVIRHDFTGDDFCRERGKALSNPVNGKAYAGLASILVRSVRQCGANVEDSPTEFVGHADIRHGVQTEPNKPLPPEIAEMIRDRCKELLRFAHFHPDPDVSADHWRGPSLSLSTACNP